MTGARELAETHVVSAAAEHVRVSIFGDRTQLDIALPFDLAVASFLTELARLVSSRNLAKNAEPPSREDNKTRWVLGRYGSDEPFDAKSTLRENGVRSGDLLTLTSERVLAIPTLYDDVVDAAASLSRTSHPAWGPRAARAMGLAGLNLVAIALVFLLISLSGRPQWAAAAAVSAVLVVAALAGATVANRSYQAGAVASAFGWSTMPVFAAVSWTLLRHYGDYGLAIGCLGMIVFSFIAYRVVGTGRWGFLCGSIVFSLCGVALLAQGLFHPRTVVTGALLAVVATLSTLSVGWLTAGFEHVRERPAEIEDDDDELFENPFIGRQEDPKSAHVNPAEAVPAAETVAERVRRAVEIRSAMLGGLAVSAATGVFATLYPAEMVTWAGVALAGVVACVLALHSRSWVPLPEKAALLAVAAVTAVGACVLAQFGPGIIRTVTFAILLMIAVVAALVTLLGTSSARMRRLRVIGDHLEYLLVAALLPLLLWVVGVYRHFGGS